MLASEGVRSLFFVPAKVSGLAYCLKKKGPDTLHALSHHMCVPYRENTKRCAIDYRQVF